MQEFTADYDAWDYLIGMDMSNIARMLRISGGDPDGKVHRLLDFTGHPADVADPWYSDRFDIAYRDILRGCEALLAHLERNCSLGSRRAARALFARKKRTASCCPLIGFR